MTEILTPDDEAPVPETELVTLADPDSLMFPPDVFGDDFLALPEGISFDIWSAIGVNLQRMGRSVNWWVGDWMAYGENVWADRIYQAVEISGMEESTVANWLYTSQRLPPAERQPVSWSHHQAVADLPKLTQRREALETAVAKGLTRNQLRMLVKQMTSIDVEVIATEDEAPADEGPTRISHTLRISMPRTNKRDMIDIVEALRKWVTDELGSRGLDDGDITVTHSDK